MMFPSTAQRVARRMHQGALLAFGTLVVFVLGWQLLRMVAGAPLAQLEEPWHRERSVVDREGRPLRHIPSALGVRGAPLELEAIGDRLISTTLVSEDRRFYDHAGVDPSAVLRAVKQNVQHGRLVSGASTVTQQLVKLLDSSGRPSKRGLWLKLVEGARATNLEQQLSKREILTAYINRLNYGRGLVGPERAARAMFGKAPSQLSWAEAALLAVLPRAPSSLDPYRHPDRVKRRQQALLRALGQHGLLSAAELERALATRIELLPVEHPFEAPHFVDSLLDEVGPDASHHLRSTLDLALQRDVEGVLVSHRERLLARGADNAAAIVVDNASGEILAYVGSLEYPAIPSGQVDHVRAPRQAGSTLKPFVYGLAFGHGLAPNDVVADVPTRFDATGTAYTPGNFDGTFHGPVSARVALASSLNVPAVRIAEQLPRGALLEWLRTSGMQHLRASPDHYGLTLALGSGEVTLRELAAAYASLARSGQRVVLRTHVTDAAHLGTAQPGVPLFTPEVVAELSDSLSDGLARVLGLGNQGPFALEFPVAVKTGTSSGYRDAWTVGFTHERTVGVWVGNSSGAPTLELTGASAAGPIFSEVLRRAMRDVASAAPLYDAELLTEVEVCPLSGLPVGPACPAPARRKLGRSRVAEWSAQTCPYHRHGHVSPTRPPRFACDAAGAQRFVVFGDEYDEWLSAQPHGAPGRDPDGLAWVPASHASGCAEQGAASLEVVEPRNGSVFLANAAGIARLSSRVRLSGAGTLDDVEFDYELDGRPLGRARGSAPVELELQRGDHELWIRPTRAGLGLVYTSFSVR